jgi:DNA modification methylase
MSDPLNGRQWRVDRGDCLTVLRGLPDDTFHCCVTSPPYFGLRDYGVAGQLGLEPTPEEYVTNIVEVFREVRRVLRPDGTFWFNIGDSYASKGGPSSNGNKGNASRDAVRRADLSFGLKPKDLVGIPWMLAFALRADGWYLRGEQIWHKPNPMTESVRDRPARSHEQVFLLAKSPRYFYDAEAVKEDVTGTAHSRSVRPNAKRQASDRNQCRAHAKNLANDLVDRRNLRSVWKISLRPYKGAHFATFPPALPERCIKAGTSERGCCGACGAPWVRQVKKVRRPTRPGKDTKTTAKHEGDGTTASTNGWNRANVVGNRDPQRHCTVTETVGWLASCDCAAGEPIPCLVLDPFAGAGTTLLVARRLARRSLGIELSPEYAEMARRRIESGLREAPKGRVKPATGPGLFDALDPGPAPFTREGD